MSDATSAKLLATAVDLLKLHLAHAAVDLAAVPALVEQVHAKLVALGGPAAAPAAPRQAPAVPIAEAVTPDGQWIVCLEDGLRFKMMKRHLRRVYGMTPDQYRAKWGLPADHPVVAPAYKAAKAEHARRVGLGAARLARGKRRPKPGLAAMAGRARDVRQPGVGPTAAG